METMNQPTQVTKLSASSGQPAEPSSENPQRSNKPFISVVIPTYNRCQMLMTAIESVLAQTYPAFEIVVVDDGSSDGTGEMLQRFIDRRSGRGVQIPPIRYFYQSNQGQSVARNKAVEEARGEWIAFMDSDDPWSPEKLEWQVRAIEQFKNDCGACLTDARLWNNLEMDTTAFKLTGKQYEQTVGIIPDAVRSFARSFVPCWVQTFLIRKDLISRAGGFDPDLHYAEDEDFLFRLSIITKYCYVNKILVSINRTNANTDPHAGSRLWDKLEIQFQGRQYMYEKWLKLSAGLPSDVRRAIVQKLRATHSSWTNWYLEIGDYEKARQAVSAAIKYEFTPALAVKWALIRIAPAFARRIAPKSKSLLV